MSYWVLPSLVSFGTSLFLGAYIFFQDAKAALNRLCMGVLALTGLGSLTELCQLQSHRVEETLGWRSFGGSWLLVAISILIISAGMVSLGVVLRLLKKPLSSRRRRQARWVAALSVFAISKIIIVRLLSYVGLEGGYPADLSTLLVLLVLCDAALRRGLFDWVPSDAAKAIVKTLEDGLVLTYPDLTVAFCNRGALDLLQCGEDEIDGQPILTRFDTRHETREWFQALRDAAPVRAESDPLEATLTTMRGLETSVSLVGSAIHRPLGGIAGFVFVIRDITDRRERDSELSRYRTQLEQIAADRMADLASANQALERSSLQLQRFSERLANAKEEEGIRISKALQNDLGQVLTGIKIEIELLSKKMKKQGIDEHEQRISGIIGLVDTAIRSIQKTTRGLRPLMLDEIGLAASIELSVDNFQKRYGIGCVFENNLREGKYDSDLSAVIYRIVQESLTNIARHSKATRARVIATDTGGSLEVSVVDNGVGIDEEELTSLESVGILGMMERARALGGSLNVFRKGVRGTQIDVAIPTRR
jgi:PAS domain S-box-containing protein